mgnify:CR=1 FL=1
MIKNILYHTTLIPSAFEILQQKKFRLSASFGTKSEMDKNHKGKMYYLSTSRLLGNRFMTGSTHYDGVNFVLDRGWFEKKYAAKPIDYWDGIWKKNAANPQVSKREKVGEAEERIYNNQPYIPLSNPAQVILEIHLLFQLNERKNDMKRWSKWVRGLLIQTKRYRIPLYWYEDREAFWKHDKRKSQPLTQLIKSLEQEKEKPYHSRYGTKDYLKSWRELYFKVQTKDLTNEARKLASNLVYYSYNLREKIITLENDIHYEKKNAILIQKMAGIWRRIKAKSAKEYVEYLSKKWTEIFKQEGKL